MQDSPISDDRDSVRVQGRLFGYPSCCVESYAVRGYARNALSRRDQRILFHWACPGCAVTRRLLPDYWRIYRLCRATGGYRPWPSVPALVNGLVTPRLRPRLAVAVSLAALSVLPAATLPVAADPLDPHVSAFTLWDDRDADFLLGSEEWVLGFDPDLMDQNTNGVPDGVDLALRLSAAVDALPETPSATEAYVTHHLAFGMENCAVCGEAVNMGFLEVRHPREDQSMTLPYIAKHFLEHGSFSYSGDLHTGRIVPPLLKFILETDGRGHLVAEPPGTDQDQDGLRDWEEPAFGTDPQQPDTDGDLLVDGIDTGRELRRALNALPVAVRPEDGPTDRPFVVQSMMNGVETCPRCGLVQTMGIWEVINPVIKDSLRIPSMALHYLEHGGFGWAGGQLFGSQGRVDPRQLQALLTGKANLHLLPIIPDRDGDGLSDQEELSLGNDPENADQNWNGTEDGLDVARAVVCELAGLPTAPSSNQVYRLDFPLRGLEQCDICGTNVNMGYLTVVNPEARLSVDVPYIALHFLEHDSLSFFGDVHGQGRLDLKLLLDTLFRPAVRLEAQETEVVLRWLGKSNRLYQVCVAADPTGPWASGPVRQGSGTEIVFTEPKQAGVTRRFYKVLVW